MQTQCFGLTRFSHLQPAIVLLHMHLVSTQAEEGDQEAEAKQSERVCQGQGSSRKEEKKDAYNVVPRSF